MRLSKEELLEKEPWFASCNADTRNKIVEIKYGDIPIRIVPNNVEVYETLLGGCHINEYKTIIHGSYDIRYGGRIFSIFLSNTIPNQSTGLSIMVLGGMKVKGFCNKNGLGSPSILSFTEELPQETIEKVLSLPLNDYGYGVQYFMEECRKVYNADKTNYIMSKTFGGKNVISKTFDGK